MQLGIWLQSPATHLQLSSSPQQLSKVATGFAAAAGKLLLHLAASKQYSNSSSSSAASSRSSSRDSIAPQILPLLLRALVIVLQEAQAGVAYAAYDASGLFTALAAGMKWTAAQLQQQQQQPDAAAADSLFMLAESQLMACTRCGCPSPVLDAAAPAAAASKAPGPNGLVLPAAQLAWALLQSLQPRRSSTGQQWPPRQCRW
uniref:Uncharacterized protein n=1 Tax=Tetradesmus obliquus TaxID=3088 RepID=A0A383VP57_TETOB|eukprot:jgi/Sobl393_1/11818/SZX67307.1